MEPEFSESIPNITVAVGRDAHLPCVLENLGSYRAAWLRVEDKGILTIGSNIITRNYRISLSHSDNRAFTLVIRGVTESDRGGYMCQVNTVPMKFATGYLDVVVPPDIIQEESSSDMTAPEGSDVSLTCRARGYPTPAIHWRREDGEKIPLNNFNGKKHVGKSCCTGTSCTSCVLM